MVLDYTNEAEVKQLEEEGILFLTEDVAKWEFFEETAGVKYYRKKFKDKALYITKAVTTLEFPVSVVAAALWDIDARCTWDPNIGASRVVEQLSEDAKLKYVSTNQILLVSPRDCVFLAKRGTLPTGGEYTVSKSVILKSIPEKPGAVRTDLWLSGNLFIPTTLPNGKEGTIITTMSVADAKGWIPTAAVNMAGAKALSFLVDFRTHLTKQHAASQ